MKLSKDFQTMFQKKWFLAGFGGRQILDLTPKYYVDIRVTDGLNGITSLRVVERRSNGNEIVRYWFACFLASQAAYRLRHLQPRSWQLDADYDGMTEYNLTEFRNDL